MKVYNLVIVYDETGDNVEYIEETIEDLPEGDSYYITGCRDGDSRSTTLDMMARPKEKAKA